MKLGKEEISEVPKEERKLRACARSWSRAEEAGQDSRQKKSDRRGGGDVR